MAVRGQRGVVMSISFGVHIPFVEQLGFTLEKFEGGHSELRFETRPEHCNSFAVTHGGACMTLLDVTMAAAARSVQADMGVVTIEMKTSFMRPAKGSLVGKGRLLYRTGKMAFTEGTIFDAQGLACAHATGTFKYVPRKPTGNATDGTLGPISTD